MVVLARFTRTYIDMAVERGAKTRVASSSRAPEGEAPPSLAAQVERAPEDKKFVRARGRS